MRQLIELEIKKYKLNRYIKGVIICIIGIMAFLTMSFIDNKIHTPYDLETYEKTIWMINVLSIDVFLIFASTIIAKIAIGEYKDKTILVMFSYPISRTKIMSAKLIIAIMFGMICIFISNICCVLYTVILDSFVDVIAGSFSLKYIWASSFAFLAFTIMGGILVLMPFSVGMRKKSIPSTIVTSVIIVALIQPLIGRNPDVLDTIIKLTVVTIIIFLLAVYTLKKYLNNVDDVDIA